MAVTPKLEIKQSQSLLMTPQLKQAINLLQLNNLELQELINQELESNPLLERENEHIAETDIETQTIDNYDDSPIPETEEFAEDIDYENAFNDDSGSDRVGYEPSWQDKYNKSADIDEDFDYLTQRAKAEESAYDLLTRQIESRFKLPKDRLIASRLLSFLDKAGYFTGNEKTVATSLKTNVSEIKRIIKIMQTFEPSGVFARSLKECLSIQLADQNKLDVMMEKFLENLPLLAKGDLPALKKLCQATDEDLASMIADIKALDPKPLAKYFTDNNSYIIPDVYVRQNKYGDYVVELNQDTLPRILINHDYRSAVAQKNKATQKYLKEKLSGATFLIKALHQRAENILRVSEEIVRWQRDFFEHGITKLRPMLLKDIADAVEIHESTVSRVINHKYMHTPSGTFELKYFFSSAAGMYNGDTQTSVTSIKHKIKQLIEEEGDKILSDDALVELLAQQSIKIARRTVAKYRDEMHIPTSAERKRKKRNSYAKTL